MMSSVLTSRFHHLLHFLLCCVMSSNHKKTTQYYCNVFMTSYRVSFLLCYYDFTGFCWDVTRELHCFVASYWACVYFIIDVIVMMQHLCFSNHYVTLHYCDVIHCDEIAMVLHWLMTSYGCFAAFIVTMTLQDFFTDVTIGLHHFSSAIHYVTMSWYSVMQYECIITTNCVWHAL